MAELSFLSAVHPSLEDASPDLEATSTLKKIYPKSLFPSPGTVRLPLGKTAYWVTLVHGIGTPSIIWKHLAPYLADNGYRVLVYDLYGRGYSEAPKCAYDTNLYITQLALLLQHVQFPQTHIIGFSMGGGVVAAFAAMFPNLVLGKVVFIASAGLKEPLTNSQPATVAPLVNSTSTAFMRELRELQTACLPGYSHALTSSFDVGPLRGLDKTFVSLLGNPNLTVQIIHGTADSTVPIKYGLKLKGLLPDAEFVSIENAEHDLVVADEHYEHVETTILRFLND